MMRLRLYQHPERTPEWVLGGVTLCWGLNAVVDSFRPVARHTMDSPFFAPLLSTGLTQPWWGAIAAIVGFVRIACLVVNGTRPRGSTTFRTIGAAFSSFFWLSLVIGAAALPWSSGAVWTYGGFLAFDALSVWRASREIHPAFARASSSHGGN